MESFDIYHVKNFDGFGTDAEFTAENYRRVGWLWADNLEGAFNKSNSLERYWGDNEGVTALNHQRSTSVGDIIRDNSTGEAFRCCSTGWEPVSCKSYVSMKRIYLQERRTQRKG